MNEIKNLVATNLKKIRLKKGVTQRELDELVSFPSSTTAKIESGKRSLEVSEYFSILKILGLSSLEFLEYKDDKVIFDEEFLIIKALRSMDFENYKNIISLIESFTYFESRVKNKKERCETDKLIQVLKKIKSKDSRPKR